MPREQINLGNPETLASGKIRYKRMLKGRVWKSTAFDQDTRRNRSDAWASFVEWRSNVRQELEQQQNELNRADPVRANLVENLQEEFQLATVSGDRKKAKWANDVLEIVGRVDAEGVREIAQMLDIPDEESPERIAARNVIQSIISSHKPQIDADRSLSAQSLADDFISLYKSKANSGQISTGRYGKVRAGLNQFLDWFGHQKSMEIINEHIVIEYYGHLVSLIGDGANQNTISDDHATFKLFVETVSDTVPEVVRPSNLRSDRYYIPRLSTEPNPFTVDECKLFIDNSSENTELCLLLMLNCGFYQGDVAELKVSEVDWESGRIIRNRSKRQKILRTKKKAKVEKVNWLLWDRTWELLQKHGHQEGLGKDKLVLVNQNGEALVRSGINEETGQEWRKDAIRSKFKRVVTKLKNRDQLPKDWKKTLNQLRKTGANLIEKSEDYAEFYSLYLDHTSTARKHYLSSGEPVPKFDAAIKWLGEQIGQATTR